MPRAFAETLQFLKEQWFLLFLLLILFLGACGVLK